MKNISKSILFLVIGFCINIVAQERPPLNVFYPSNYGGSSQNWSISQAENRYIYVANNSGLLEFNGTKWNLYSTPNETITRSVKVVNNIIYTAGYHDFGFWKRNNFGVLTYTSLAKALDANFLEDEEFWNIIAIENIIIFQSLDRIHIYNQASKSYTIVNFAGDISKLFKVNSSVFFQSLNNGLFKIENGTPVLVSNNDIINSNLIVNMFEHEGSVFMLTQDNGFYKLLNTTIEPWDIPAKDALKSVSVFSGIQLKDKSFALGTISNGFMHLSKKGALIFEIDQASGLSNNTILSIYEDFDNNLWLGLDNGINCVNIKSPYSIYFDKTGKIGSVYTSIVFNGFLYLGTNQGLFFKPIDSNNKFQFIKGTQGQVWFLNVIKNKLFCGHNSGTFIIDNNTVTKIADVNGTWSVKPIDGNENLLIQGNYDGLYILHKQKDLWVVRNKIAGFDVSSRYFEFSKAKELYLSHEYKGVFKLKLNNDLTEVETVVLDSTMKRGVNSSLIKHNKNIIYATKGGVFKLSNTSNTFIRDTLLSKLIEKESFTSAKIVNNKKTNKLWCFNARGINYLATSKLSGETKLNNIPFPIDTRKDVVGYESVALIDDQKFLLGSRSGYFVLDLDKAEVQNHEITINQIEVSNLTKDNNSRLVDISSDAEFSSTENTIQFSYSISEFLKTQEPEYRYKLEGRYNEWSDWTTDGNIAFENLPYGNYTFVVNGRVGNQPTTNNASYNFTIARPWFLSNLAIAGYLAAILLFSLFMHNVYKRYYRKQREKLMVKTKRDFELKELENKQQLMRFRNDKLREDIENKNRELGISTMNLIKKNEFLNTLKSELEQVDDARLKKVIKIIDKNLNNNDDWNLFQEAFNNADKDFLKKIKSIHPNLTSNDLRLCAYLRLNLSSKEIAPLLNISHRSVEVKRYRLRKKMDLVHEASLSDYILEI